MAQSLIHCAYCNNQFFKENKYIRENIRLGYKSFCSHFCQDLSKQKRKILSCENPGCKKIFSRKRSHLSFRNFCSQSCAMKIIGPENGNYHKKICYCSYCGKQIKVPHTYCSSKCWGLTQRISPKFLVNTLQKLSLRLKRVPTKESVDNIQFANIGLDLGIRP